MGQFRTVWYKILCYNGRVKEDGSGLAFVYELFSTQRVFRWMPNSLSCTECSPCPAESHWYPAYANRLLKVDAQCRTMPRNVARRPSQYLERILSRNILSIKKSCAFPFYNSSTSLRLQTKIDWRCCKHF